MKTLFFIFTFILLTSFLLTTIINVPADQPTIQTGINAAVENDTVLVAPGIYYENDIYIGENIIVGSYFLTTRDTTFIDSTIVDGSALNNIFLIDYCLELSGFTIRNGNGSYAGGIWIRGNGSTPITITNNVISGNHCTGYHSNEGGGGINIWVGNVTISQNKIFGNHSDTMGGGICTGYNSQATIIENIISNNSADIDGGGIVTSIRGFGATIIENTITNNLASNKGGGIACQDTIGSIIENNLINENNADNGGGIHCLTSNPTIQDNTINNNTAFYGGGIYCYNEANPLIIDNKISGNTCMAGTIECILNSVPVITNNIFTYNYAPIAIIQLTSGSPLVCNNTFYDNSGELIQCNSTTAIIKNNIVFSNSGVTISSNNPSVAIAYNDFYDQPEPLFSGSLPANLGIISQTNLNGDPCDVYNNIFLDPLLADITNYDFHLTEFSPCVDAGDPTLAYDPDGTISDMGVFYFDQTIALIPPQNVTIGIIGTEIHLSWNPVINADYYIVYSSDDPSSGFTEDTTGAFAGESWSSSLVNEKKFYYVVASSEL